jgi:hypothetical protein
MLWGVAAVFERVLPYCAILLVSPLTLTICVCERACANYFIDEHIGMRGAVLTSPDVDRVSVCGRGCVQIHVIDKHTGMHLSN